MSAEPRSLNDTVIVRDDNTWPQDHTPWPRLIHDGHWVDPDGTRWHIRGRELDGRAARKLLKRPGIRVLHVYGPEPRLVDGADRDALVANLETFLPGRAQPHADFHVADFRDEDRNIMAVVEESC